MPRKRRPEGTRAPNGASSIYYSETDGYWHGRVTMGVRDDGKPDRRHVQAKTETEVIDKVRKLERDRDSGNARKPGRAWTVEKWLTHWVENIAVHSVRYKTLQGYRTAVYKHLIPGIGAHRMDRIEPEHFERFYARMQAAGASAGTAHQVHRTAKTAFNEYFRRQRITGNPIAFVKAPRVEEKEVEPFTPQEAKSIITAALKRRNGVRYVVALALGCRQGEALGFKWDRLDRGNRLYRVRQALQRQAWQHGCDDPHACGATSSGGVPGQLHPASQPQELHSRREGPPPSVPAELHQAREQLPAAARWWARRGRREVEGWSPELRSAR
ncbi:tyrosine-type recombinase/integrase [Saccharopolyspora spinosporotrichia]